MTVCLQCGSPLPNRLPGPGRSRRFCRDACRAKASHAAWYQRRAVESARQWDTDPATAIEGVIAALNQP